MEKRGLSFLYGRYCVGFGGFRGGLTPISSSLQGLVLVIHHPNYPRAMGLPSIIILLYHINLPLTRPPLHRLLPRDSIRNQRMAFKPDKPCCPILCRETIRVMFGFMFLKTPRKVGRHAQINRPVLTVRQHINITKAHCGNLQEMDCKRQQPVITRPRSCNPSPAFHSLEIKYR